MARLFKKKPGIGVALFLVWGLLFAFSPFYHYHPDNVHGHIGELNPHEHAGHLHSHEWESIAHALNLHPAAPEQDKNHHHSHSSAEHDADYYEVNLHQTNIKPGKSYQEKNNDSVLTILAQSEQTLSHFLPLAVRFLKTPQTPEIPKERSPPILLI